MAIQNHRGPAVRPAGATEQSDAPKLQSDVSAETFLDEKNQPVAGNKEAGEAGSWWSHAAFGLSPLALVAPFLIPGIPRRELLVIYLAVGAVVMITLMVWGVIQETREARRVRRKRRADRFW